MRLPTTLRPWEESLTLLDDTVVEALGPWLVRLDLLVGALAVSLRTGRTELDGLSGLARRGPYDRLLLSEWALADEVPDEFIRRAAMGEHLFLEPDRREPAGQQASVAVFDTGPDQLGAPRLAHLALAIVLARRAAAAGVPFATASLAHVERRPWDAASSLPVLVERRTLLRGDASQVDRWSKALPADGVSDRWLVGGPAARAFDGRWLVVEEGPGGLRVELGVPGRPPRAVELKLPEPRVCVRLLRDPLGRKRAAPRSVRAPGPTSGMRFSADGRRLLMRRADGSLVGVFLPNAPGGQWGHDRVAVVPPGRSLEAVGWLRRRFVTIMGPARGTPPALLTGGFQGPPRDVTIVSNREAEWGGRATPPLVVFPGTRTVLFSSANGLLFTMTPDVDEVVLVDANTFGLVYRWGTACWGKVTPDGRRVVRFCYDPLAVQDLPLDLGKGPAQLWFGPAAGHSFPTGSAVAPTEDGYVVVRATAQPQVVERLDVKTTAAVFGVAIDATGGALLGLSPDRLSVLAIPMVDAPPTVIATARTPIEQIEDDPCSSRFAWRERSGRLVVWSIQDGKPLLDLQPEAS